MVTRDRALHMPRRHVERRQYEQIIERYLSDCYAARTVARVSELADLLEVPRPYLSRVIPQLFGRPLRTVLRDKQIDEAKRLLRVTRVGIDEIAAASAFGDRSTLFRIFRAAVGITPEEYRKQVTDCDSRDR